MSKSGNGGLILVPRPRKPKFYRRCRPQRTCSWYQHTIRSDDMGREAVLKAAALWNITHHVLFCKVTLHIRIYTYENRLFVRTLRKAITGIDVFNGNVLKPDDIGGMPYPARFLGCFTYLQGENVYGRVNPVASQLRCSSNAINDVVGPASFIATFRRVELKGSSARPFLFCCGGFPDDPRTVFPGVASSPGDFFDDARG